MKNLILWATLTLTAVCLVVLNGISRADYDTMDHPASNASGTGLTNIVDMPINEFKSNINNRLRAAAAKIDQLDRYSYSMSLSASQEQAVKMRVFELRDKMESVKDMFGKLDIKSGPYEKRSVKDAVDDLDNSINEANRCGGLTESPCP